MKVGDRVVLVVPVRLNYENAVLPAGTCGTVVSFPGIDEVEVFLTVGDRTSRVTCWLDQLAVLLPEVAQGEGT